MTADSGLQAGQEPAATQEALRQPDGSVHQEAAAGATGVPANCPALPGPSPASCAHLLPGLPPVCEYTAFCLCFSPQTSSVHTGQLGL